MKLKDILSMSNEDFNKLSYKELKPIVKQMVNASNNRIYRMRESGVFSPAVNDRKLLNMANTQNLNQLRAKFVQVQTFLLDKTSTIEGAREFMDLVQGNINSMRESRQWKLNYADLTNKQQSKMWKLYEAIRELKPELFAKLDSGQRIALASKFYRASASFASMRQKLNEFLTPPEPVDKDNNQENKDNENNPFLPENMDLNILRQGHSNESTRRLSEKDALS